MSAQPARVVFPPLTAAEVDRIERRQLAALVAAATDVNADIRRDVWDLLHQLEALTADVDQLLAHQRETRQRTIRRARRLLQQHRQRHHSPGDEREEFHAG